MKIKYQRMIQTLMLLVISCAFLWGCSFLNDYQDSGELKLTGLKAPVKVMRDEKGMAYIETRKDTHHLEFKLAGIAPTKWTVQDSLSLAYLLSWDSAANLKTEIIAQMLVDAIGPENARSLFPLNINPDDPSKKTKAGSHSKKCHMQSTRIRDGWGPAITIHPRATIPITTLLMRLPPFGTGG